MQDADRQRRAEARRSRMVLRRGRLRADEHDLDPLSGPEAVSLVYRLTRESWALAGQEEPTYSRDRIPVRFVRWPPK